MPTKRFATAARLSAPEVPMLRESARASRSTTRCSTPRWYRTPNRLPMITMTDSTWIAKEKPVSASAPNTKRTPASV